MSSKDAQETFLHTIKAGDSFYKLAQKYNTSVSEIYAVNPGVNSINLKIGQSIRIPINEPVAVANLIGGPLRPQISGHVSIYDVSGGSWVCTEVNGLPPYQPATNGDPIGPHGYHIHQFGNCRVGDPLDPFQAAGNTGTQ